MVCECVEILKSINSKYKENIDYETGITSKTRHKIDKSRYLTSLNRGRSQ